MVDEPFCRALDDALQRARLLEKMGGARNDIETVAAAERLLRAAIEFDDAIIQSADDQQCRRLHALQEQGLIVAGGSASRPKRRWRS